MVRILVTLTAAAICSAHAELLLTPNVSEYEVEGVKFKEVAFSDGDNKVTYQPPAHWEYNGSSTQLTLHPPGKTQAEATISRFPLSGPSPFVDDTLKKLVAEAAALLPKESSEITVLSQQKNPLTINHKDTFEVVLSYRLLGQVYHRSILFVNRDSEQVRFQLTARDVDFDELHAAFQGSLYSIQNL
jgi:hypothetical protein